MPPTNNDSQGCPPCPQQGTSTSNSEGGAQEEPIYANANEINQQAGTASRNRFRKPFKLFQENLRNVYGKSGGGSNLISTDSSAAQPRSRSHNQESGGQQVARASQPSVAAASQRSSSLSSSSYDVGNAERKFRLDQGQEQITMSGCRNLASPTAAAKSDEGEGGNSTDDSGIDSISEQHQHKQQLQQQQQLQMIQDQDLKSTRRRNIWKRELVINPPLASSSRGNKSSDKNAASVKDTVKAIETKFGGKGTPTSKAQPAPGKGASVPIYSHVTKKKPSGCGPGSKSASLKRQDDPRVVGKSASLKRQEERANLAELSRLINDTGALLSRNSNLRASLTISMKDPNSKEPSRTATIVIPTPKQVRKFSGANNTLSLMKDFALSTASETKAAAKEEPKKTTESNTRVPVDKGDSSEEELPPPTTAFQRHNPARKPTQPTRRSVRLAPKTVVKLASKFDNLLTEDELKIQAQKQKNLRLKTNDISKIIQSLNKLDEEAAKDTAVLRRSLRRKALAMRAAANSSSKTGLATTTEEPTGSGSKQSGQAAVDQAAKKAAAVGNSKNCPHSVTSQAGEAVGEVFGQDANGSRANEEEGGERTEKQVSSKSDGCHREKEMQSEHAKESENKTDQNKKEFEIASNNDVFAESRNAEVISRLSGSGAKNADCIGSSSSSNNNYNNKSNKSNGQQKKKKTSLSSTERYLRTLTATTRDHEDLEAEEEEEEEEEIIEEETEELGDYVKADLVHGSSSYYEQIGSEGYDDVGNVNSHKYLDLGRIGGEDASGSCKYIDLAGYSQIGQSYDPVGRGRGSSTHSYLALKEDSASVLNR